MTMTTRNGAADPYALESQFEEEWGPQALGEFSYEQAAFGVFEDEWSSPEAPAYEAGYEAGVFEDEWSPEAGYEAGAFEDESSPEAFGYESGYEAGAYEDEWSPEASYEAGVFEDEWSAPEAPGYEAGVFEDEWSPEAGYEAGAFEDEWSPEAGYEAGFEAGVFEDEWSPEVAWEQEGVYEDEGDPFLPLLAGLAPLAAKAVPFIAKAAMPLAKQLLPFARGAVGGVVKSVLGSRRPAMPALSQLGRGLPLPTPARGGPVLGKAPAAQLRRRATIANLLRQLSSVLGNGEAEAAAAEASFFGQGESLGEVAGNGLAQEAALTEVMAAEAAHGTTEAEAEALLSASLPITIRIMGASRAVRPLMPALVQANTSLVRGIRRSGPQGRQLLRLVPAIQRRTVASLTSMQRSGQRPQPALVPQVMAGQAARVLGTPRLAGPALVRNTAIRQRTVAPAGRTY